MTWMVKRSEDTLSHSAGHKYIDKYRDNNGNWQYIYDNGREKNPVKNTIREAYVGLKNATALRPKKATSKPVTEPSVNTGNAVDEARKKLAAANHEQEILRNMRRNKPVYKNGIPANATQPVKNTVNKSAYKPNIDVNGRAKAEKEAQERAYADYKAKTITKSAIPSTDILSKSYRDDMRKEAAEKRAKRSKVENMLRDFKKKLNKKLGR